MDCKKVGSLILKLRREKNMTQKQLALAMNLSDKTISKWERGLGCPDVSIIKQLSDIFGVNIDSILTGDLNLNEADIGNINKLKFFVCKKCGNLTTSTGQAKHSCCGRKLDFEMAKSEDSKHKLEIEEIEEDYYISITHEMSKSHYISFVAYVSCDRLFLGKLYPEQGAELRLPKLYGGTLYFYCNQHGLWKKEIKIGGKKNDR